MKKSFLSALLCLALCSFIPTKSMLAQGALVLNYQVDVLSVTNTIIFCNSDDAVTLTTNYHFDVQGVINKNRSNIGAKITMTGTAVNALGQVYTHNQFLNTRENVPAGTDGKGASVYISSWEEVFTNTTTGLTQTLIGKAKMVITPDGKVAVDKDSFTFTCDN